MHATDYTITNGIIQNPGKFEGEPAYAPYFWDAVLNGECCDEFETADEQTIAFFRVQPADIHAYPELASIFGVSITNDARGFVYVNVYSDRLAYHAAITEAERLQAEWCADGDSI